ncbi:MAG: putative peptidoglycan lipid flippase [Nocardioidaceae bacterium]|nr:putative peptidoglycan lipid flippase [Nocardioidaceae bacterium]
MPPPPDGSLAAEESSDEVAKSRGGRHKRQKGLSGNAAVTVVGALAGVLTGLLLDVAIAATFGAGAATDALFVAMRLPIGLAVIVMASANQSLVPTFTSWRAAKNADDFSRSVCNLLTATLVLGACLALVGSLLAAPLMAVTAPGLSGADSSRAAQLAMILFWILPCVAAAEVLRAYMNAQRRFGVPAAMNVVMNGGAALIILVWGSRGIAVAATAYLAGALAQLLFMMLMASRTGLRLRPVVAFRDPELLAAGRVSVRPLTAAGLNPLARLAEQILVSFLPSGSITIVNYANRLVSAIGGTVLFRSVMVVLLPRLTEAHHHGDRDEARSLVRSGILLMLRLAIPLTALMAVLSVPGALAVFHRGQFSRQDAVLLGITLAVYSSSLVGQAVQRALLAPFYAALSMRVPLRNSVWGLVANIVLLLPVAFFLRGRETAALVGVGLAFSLSQYVNVAHAWWHLRRTLGKVAGPSMRRRVAVLLAASLVEAAVLVAGTLLMGLQNDLGRLDLLVRTSVVAVCGLLAFAACVAVAQRTRLVGRGQQLA